MNPTSNSFLHELQNNEAILLMYLANELPAQDREEVEHMLDRDDNLRMELTRVQQMYQGYHVAMRQVDAGLPSTSPFSAARAVGDVVRQRVGEPPSVDDHEEHSRHIHWAMYPAVAAAVIMIGMFLWWRYPTGDDPSQPQVTVTYNHFGRDFDRGDGGMRRDFDGEFADRQILRAFEPMNVNRMGGGSDWGSGEAQRQIAAIHFLDDSLQ